MSRAMQHYRIVGESAVCNIVVMLVSLAYCKGERLQYSWLQETDQFDFMVGISIDGVPVCSGAMIYPDQVITTATPFRYHGVQDGRTTRQKIYGHVVYRTWNNNTGVAATHISYQVTAYNYTLKTFGDDGIFTAIYDIALLALDKVVPTHAAALRHRHPRCVPRLPYRTIKSSGTFTVLGHGHVDRLHVQQNVELEADDYPVDSVLVDCDEWVPRSWGKFICLSNVDNFVGITSGGVLAYDGWMVGVGSFSLTRGGETILLFSDLRRHRRNYMYYNRPRPTAPMW